MNISSEKFELRLPKLNVPLNFYRGTVHDGKVMRFTLKAFESRDAAELYTLALMLRYRSIFQ